MERNDFKSYTNNGWTETKSFTFIGVPKKSRFPISIQKWLDEKKDESVRFITQTQSSYCCDCCKNYWKHILEKDENATVNLIETIHIEYNIINEPFEVKSNKFICDKCLDTLIRIKKLNRL